MEKRQEAYPAMNGIYVRHKLKNPYYFSGLYEGKENEKLWREVYDYISHVFA